MPVLEIAGKRVEFETMPSEQEIDEVAQSFEPKNPAFLPKSVEVERKISERQDSVAALGQELQTHWNPFEHPVKAALQPAVTGLKAISIPFQRAEAGVASAGLAAQRGDFGAILPEAAQGLAGSRQAQLGDIVRTTGFGGKANEALATGVGLAGALPVFGGVEAGAAKAAGAIGKAAPVSKGAQWISDKMMMEYLHPKESYMRYGKRPEAVIPEERLRATNAEDLLNKIQMRRQDVGKKIGDIVKDSEKPADYSDAIRIIDQRIASLKKDNPKEMAGLIKRLEDKKSDLLHEVVDEQGNITSIDDVSNMTLKQAHDLKDRTIHTATTNVFGIVPKDEQIYNETLRDVYRKISKKMVQEEPALRDLNRRYGNLVSADQSLTHRIQISGRNTGIVGDAASAAVGGVAGHVPGMGLGVLAHRMSKTAAFKTNASILLSDIAKGARSVEDLLKAFSKEPEAIRSALKSASQDVKDAVIQKYDEFVNSGNMNLGVTGQAGVKSEPVVKKPEATLELDVRSKLTPEEIAQAKKEVTPDQGSTIAQWHKAGDVLPAAVVGLGTAGVAGTAQAAKYDTDKLDKYVKRFKGSPMTGEMLAAARDKVYKETGVLVPDELVLSQAQFETKFGTNIKRSGQKTNPFNVGEEDKKTTKKFKTIQEGIEAYYRLMAKNYLKDKSADKLMKNFVDKHGRRYASDKDYEKKISGQAEFIKRWMSRKSKKGVKK